jgi:hypothetical protein
VDSGRWQISTEGGTRPAWARSSRELFYLDASNTLTAVPVQTSGSTFRAGKPAKVFDAKYSMPFPPRHYDVSPDGQRFLMLKDSARRSECDASRNGRRAELDRRAEASGAEAVSYPVPR